ncbi:MAG: twin-arginine translocase TatA/TatE family subunit [Kiritimatiellae bacterium]|nr:twin-arginine translocase TatA/TatE family subunit [Kiritimatiellia bacterium]
MALGFIQNCSPWQLMVIVVLIVVLFGSKKIPDLARSLGKAKNEFKKGLAEGAKDSDEAEKASEPAKEIA